jgi:hypothetical protein
VGGWDCRSPTAAHVDGTIEAALQYLVSDNMRDSVLNSEQQINYVPLLLHLPSLILI